MAAGNTSVVRPDGTSQDLVVITMADETDRHERHLRAAHETAVRSDRVRTVINSGGP